MALSSAPSSWYVVSSSTSVSAREERLAGVHRQLLTTYQLQGALDKAIGVGRKALEFYVTPEGGGNGPDATEAANALAVALASAGALEEAEQVARSAHEAHSSHPRPSPRLLLGLQATGCATLVRAQKTEEALYLCGQALGPAVELEGASSIMVGKLHAYMAAAHLKENNALAALEEGLQGLPMLRELAGDGGRPTQSLAYTIQGALALVGEKRDFESLAELHTAAKAVMASLPKAKPQTQ